MSAAARYFNCTYPAIKHRIEDKHTKLEQFKDVILEEYKEEVER
jgi:hypothetical protein